MALLATAAPTKSFGQDPLGFQPERAILTPGLGNYPDTSLALSGNTTVTPDAAPTMTSSINVSISTNFKGRLEGNPATGVVRVTDAHPAGMYVVTVRAFDNGGLSVTKTFMLTVTTPSTCTPVRFAATNFAVGTNPRSVAVGDFNGDGKQDLAIANYTSNKVSILLGNGTGGFSTATNFSVGTGPYSVAVGDFNGDGKQDMATANSSSNNVSILLGDGMGNFSAATNFAAGSSPLSVATGDFNGDGKQDLAVGNGTTPGTVSVLLGNGSGSFGVATSFAVDGRPYSVAVGDFNGDGDQDIVAANFLFSNTVSILLGDGTGQFSASADFDTASRPISVAVGDFNGDANQDLAVANNNSSNVSILLGNGAGTFSAPTNFGAGGSPLSVAVGDFNGDGNQDIAVVNSSSNNLSVLLGNGTGNFSAAINFGAGVSPQSTAVGDFNGDGKQDLAAVNYNSSNVSVLLRVCDLTPTSAASRKTHGSTSTFDINLPLAGTMGIESRTTGGTNDYSLIVAFSGAVTLPGNPQAQVISGAGCVGSAGTCSGNGTVTISGNVVTVPLTNVANAQTINVRLNGVSGGIGNVVIPMGVLSADVNANGSVNASDVALTKSRSGQVIDATNFRSDVNANGTMNATDASLAKSAVGTALP